MSDRLDELEARIHKLESLVKPVVPPQQGVTRLSLGQLRRPEYNYVNTYMNTMRLWIRNPGEIKYHVVIDNIEMTVNDTMYMFEGGYYSIHCEPALKKRKYTYSRVLKTEYWKAARTLCSHAHMQQANTLLNIILDVDCDTSVGTCTFWLKEHDKVAKYEVTDKIPICMSNDNFI